MRVRLTNPYIFWVIVTTSTLLIFLYNTSTNLTHYGDKIKTYTDHSLRLENEKSNPNNNINMKIDLDKIENAKNEENFIVNDIHNLSLDTFDKEVAVDNALTLVYAAFISILFVIRERQNQLKIINLEKLEDERNIKRAKEAPIVIQNISSELSEFQELIKNDLNSSAINERIENEPKYIVIASKNILEQVITKMYKKYLNQDNTNLNIMIVDLFKKGFLNHQSNNFAHIIKSFGNKANHTNKIFDSREAVLAVSNLIEFLKELNRLKILTDLNA